MENRRRYHPTDFGNLQWARLLDFELGRADSFECTLPYRYVSMDIWRERLWPDRLQALRPDMTDRYATFVRGERMRDDAAQIVRFRMTPRVARFIRSIRHLESWSWPNELPEDPAFFLGDTLLLATESRQGRITVYADATDVATLHGAGVRLIEPLGVQADPWPTP